MKKRILALMLVASFLLSATVYAQVDAIQVGDYLELGTYKSSKLVWQVIAIDKDGIATLYSRDIVERMAFDAAESGVSGQGDDAQAYGSNRYANSNIKEWLNSDSYMVDYTTTKPSAESVVFQSDFEDLVSSGLTYEVYGFLNDFSEDEKGAILSSTYTVDLSSEFRIGQVEAPLPTQNAEVVTSKVFLLSLGEYKNLVVDQGLDRSKKDAMGLLDYYWLRTPYGRDDVQVATVDQNGFINKNTANFGSTGVVPAIKIDITNYPVFLGEGSKYSPYTVDYSYAKSIGELLDFAQRQKIELKVEGFVDELALDGSTTHQELIARSIESDIDSVTDPNSYLVGYRHYMDELNLVLHRSIFVESRLIEALENKSVSFNDLSTSSQVGVSSITEMAAIGVINGYEDGGFRPNNTITRAETAKVLSLLTQTYSKSYTKNFTDVASGSWYYDYVESVKKQKYIEGYTDGSFRPAGNVTYDELSTMLSRILVNDYGYYEYNGDRTKDLSADSYAASWAKPYVSMLIECDVIEEGQTYQGSMSATREDVMILCNRVRELIYQ